METSLDPALYNIKMQLEAASQLVPELKSLLADLSPSPLLILRSRLKEGQRGS